MKTLPILAVAASAAFAAACGHHAGAISLAHGALQVHEHDVTIQRSGGPDAQVSAGGTLKIGSDEVAVSAEQRAQLASYFNAAMAIPGHAAATGQAGAAAGAAAITEVVHGLASGDTSQIGAKVEAKADEVKRQAMNLCDDIATIRSAQEALAATLEAFRPYAVVSADEGAHCRKDLATKPAA